LSTQPNLTPQWKEEVNRRLAAHKSRRSQSTTQEATEQASIGGSRAAEAAARVAARYAKAPSYSQMQAEEARVAVRHAEIATKVALEAQAVAETHLAGLHAATQPARPPGVVQSIAPVAKPEIEPVSKPNAMLPAIAAAGQTPVQTAVPAAVKNSAAGMEAVSSAPPVEPRVFGIRWDPDLPVRPLEPKQPIARRAQEEFELSVDDWWSPAEVAETLRNQRIEVAEAEATHANLIQFPRELVATRKLRPRLAEAQAGTATDAEGQLSIFEVDPAAISTQAAAVGEAGASASIWSRAEWTGMRLDTNPVDVLSSASEVGPALGPLPVASVGFRLMAAVVDGALILASFVSAAFLVAHNISNPPSGKGAEALGLAGLVVIGILYYAFFFAFPVSTPGMKYAGIGLCTFDDKSPTREQLRRRLVAMLLSLVPVGLGLVWSLFDEDHLSWHDRFSQTYLRKL